MKKQFLVLSWPFAIAATLATALLSHAQIARSNPPNLQLIAAVNIPTSFLTDETVYADQQRVYLTGYDGRLYVLDRSGRGYPVRASFPFSSRALRSVRGDRGNIYVTSDDGNLYVIEKHNLGITRANPSPRRTSVSRLGLDSLYVGRDIIVSTVFAEMAADPEHVYVASLNTEPALELSGPRSSVAVTYQGSALGATSVYDQNAQLLGTLVNPSDFHGRASAGQPVF